MSLLSLNACTGYSILGGPGPIVTPDLVSQETGDLHNISSIVLQPVTLTNRARNEGQRSLWFNQALEDAARAELSIQVLGAKDSKEVPNSAQRAGTQAVLHTSIVEYTERSGSALSADAPASVQFAMSLRNLRDGTEIWQASYLFRDQALSENLFRLKQSLDSPSGPHWRTAEELITQGFSSAFKDIAQKREAHFLSK